MLRRFLVIAGLVALLMAAMARRSHAQLEPCRRAVTPVQPSYGTNEEIRKKANDLEPYDLERRRAAAAIANFNVLTPSDWRTLATNAFGEGTAREAYRLKQFEAYQKKEISWTVAWARIQASEKEDYYLAPWIRLETALRNRDPAAMAAVEAVLDAANKAGVPASWGGDRKLVAEELLRKAKTIKLDGGAEFKPPQLGTDLREKLRVEDLLGLAELWSKLSPEERAQVNQVLDFRVNEALRAPTPREKELALEKLGIWVKKLAKEEIEGVVNKPPPRFSGSFEGLPLPIQRAILDTYKTPEARGIIEAVWNGASPATAKAIEQAILELMDAQDRGGRVPMSAYVNVVINGLFSNTDSLGVLNRGQISVWENKKDNFYNYAFLRALKVPALAARERKEANILTDDRRKAFADAIAREMADPAFKRQREREAKEREVRGRNGFEAGLYMARGFVLQGKDTVVGLAHIVVHPIETVEGLWFAVNNPETIAKVIAISLDESLEDTDDFAGRVGFEVALALATAGTGTAPEAAVDGARALNVASKEALLAGKVDKARRLAQEAEKLAAAAAKAKELSTPLRSQLIDAAEEGRKLAALARNAEAVAHAAKAEELAQKAAQLAKAGDFAGARKAARTAVEEARAAEKAAKLSGAPEAALAAEKAALAGKQAELLREAGSAAKKWKAPSADEYAKLRDLGRQAAAKREIAQRLERSIEQERIALREGRPLPPESAGRRPGERPVFNQSTRNGASLKDAEKLIAQYQEEAARIERELAGKLNPRDALVGAEDAKAAAELAKELGVEKAFAEAVRNEIAADIRKLHPSQRPALNKHYEDVAKAAGTSIEDVGKQIKNLETLELAGNAWKDFVAGLAHHDQASYGKHLKATSDATILKDAQKLGEGQYFVKYKDLATRTALEKEALLGGYRIEHGGSIHVYYKAKSPVGATADGKLTEWLRVEIDSTGKVHSHPRPVEQIPAEARRLYP